MQSVKSRGEFFSVNKKASLDVLCFPSRTMHCMGPSPHSNVCDCRSILATRRLRLGRPCEVSECGEASAVSVEDDRFAILIVVQKLQAYGVVVHWRCWLVQAIPRHQAQVSFKITLHACHDCTDATSKFQFRRQPFHTFQRSTKTHRLFLLVFAACSAASGTSLWASRPQEQSGHPQWFLTSPHDPRSSLVIGSEIGVSSTLLRELVPRASPRPSLTATVTFNFERVFLSSGSRGKEKKNHTFKSCSFVVFVESNCKLKRSR